MQRRDINAPDASPPAGQYTQAVEVAGVSRTLYVSGQIPAAPDGSVPDDTTAQCRLAWNNIAAQLRASGMGFDNIVKITTILPNHAALAASRAPAPRPSATAAQPAHCSSVASPIRPGRSKSR